MDESVRLIVTVVLLVLGCWLVFSMPIWIAKDRKVSEQTIKSIRILSVLGLFFGITWLVALIWACLAPVGLAKELVYEGAGMYEINGIDKETSLEVLDYIAANSKQNAILKAEVRGILVSSAKYKPQ